MQTPNPVNHKPPLSLPPVAPVKTFLSGDQIRPADLEQPFIYRQCPWLPGDTRRFRELLCREKQVYGYSNAPADNSSDNNLGYLSGEEAWELFQTNRLKVNIVDSTCTDPGLLLANWRSEVLKKPPFVSWVLTNAPKLTYFHTDTPFGNCFMYLVKGEKTWRFIAPAELAYIESRYYFAIINELPLDELVLLDDRYLWGKIQTGTIGDGDLIYFPDHWAHFVQTTQHSFGFGGYFGEVPENYFT